MEAVVKNNLLGSVTILDDAFAVSRTEALKNLLALGLPSAKTEEYKHTAITRLLEKNFQSLEPTPFTSQIDIKNYLIKDLDAHVLVFINGVFSASKSNYNSNEISVSLIEKSTQANEKISQHLGQYADSQADAFVALNTATWNHGVAVEVKNNIVATKPIILHHIANATQGPVVTATRNIVAVGKNSEVSVMEKYDSVGEANFTTVVNEITVAENAGVTYTLIQNDEGKRYQFNHTVIHQQRNSRVNCFTLSLNGKLIRNNLHLILDGEGIDSHMYGLYLLTGDTIADNHTVVDHRKPNSVSNEMYKGVMDGQSKGVFNGKIFVRPDAQKTNAFQSNRNIILSDKASVNTKPQLEIWADDVKCSHGCTSGQLDEEALFYLRSRGVAKDAARALLLYAYAGEVINKIENEALRTYIDSLVSERLHKNF
jgi:Fe-S cluster assembly protein SufD